MQSPAASQEKMLLQEMVYRMVVVLTILFHQDYFMTKMLQLLRHIPKSYTSCLE